MSIVVNVEVVGYCMNVLVAGSTYLRKKDEYYIVL